MFEALKEGKGEGEPEQDKKEKKGACGEFMRQRAMHACRFRKTVAFLME